MQTIIILNCTIAIQWMIKNITHSMAILIGRYFFLQRTRNMLPYSLSNVSEYSTTNASLAELPSNQANGSHYGNAQNDLMEPSSASPVPPEQPAAELYRIEEDEHCKAKEYYVTSKQLVTDFHIDALHNMYVPNINGNWDHKRK